MMRKVVTSEGQDWEKWWSYKYMLFAYREGPQSMYRTFTVLNHM